MTRRPRSRDTLLWWLLWAAVGARALVAVAYLEQVWPDEHFQTLEPAGSLLWEFGWLAWEWQEGVRSWLVPAFYVPVLAACKALGLDGGPGAIIACRLLMVGVSALFLWRFGAVLSRDVPSRLARVFAFIFVGFAPAMLVYGAATLADGWALCFLWAATASLSAGLADPGVRRPFLVGGALLGLAFVVRPQTAVWTLTCLACLVGRAPTRRSALAVALGVAVPVCLHGLLDWAIWSTPFHSTLAYARVHLLEGVSDAQGQLPLYAYFGLTLLNLGPVPTLAAVFLPLAALWRRVLRVGPGRGLWLWPALVYLVAHVLIPHKEARFLLPVYPALILLAACALSDLVMKYNLAVVHCSGASVAAGASAAPGATPAPRSAWVHGWAAVGCALAAGTSLSFVDSPAHFEPSDLSALMRGVRDDGLLRRQPAAALLLVDDYFVWTRGELLQGHSFRWRERPLAAFLAEGPLRLEDVAYVISSGAAAGRVAGLLGDGFRELTRSRWGHVLWRSELLAAQPAPGGVAGAAAARAPGPVQSGPVRSGSVPSASAQVVAGRMPPPGVPEIPVDRVPSAALVQLYEEALRKEPENRAIRRGYAELCRARGLPCARTQFERLLQGEPGSSELRAIVEALRRR